MFNHTKIENRPKIKGKYFIPFKPKLSLMRLVQCVYISSVTICHLVGINHSFLKKRKVKITETTNIREELVNNPKNILIILN